MTSPESLFQTLYVSQLAAEADFSAVKEIVSAARRANPLRGITGALVFDGEYFGQLLEGRESEVTALMQRIEFDPRHRAVTTLFGGGVRTTRLTRAWRSGYCEARQLDALVADATLRGPAALAAFLAILQGADIE